MWTKFYGDTIQVKPLWKNFPKILFFLQIHNYNYYNRTALILGLQLKNSYDVLILRQQQFAVFPIQFTNFPFISGTWGFKKRTFTDVENSQGKDYIDRVGRHLLFNTCTKAVFLRKIEGSVAQ